MSSYKKFLIKLQKRPCLTDITFDETYNFLTSEKVGYTAVSNGGSHYQFRKEGARPFTLVAKRHLMEYNIKQILASLEDAGLI